MTVFEMLYDLFENVLTELSTAALIFFGGFLTSKILYARQKAKEAKLFEDSVHIATDIICDAEELFKGPKRGGEKLKYAVKRFIDETECDDYEKAQNYIVQIFNMTRLSEEDFPPRSKKREPSSNPTDEASE